jgi:hypothetical protein
MKNKSMIKTIKNKIIAKRYNRQLNKSVEYINNMANNENGFIVIAEQEDGNEIEKAVRPDNFSHAFHKDIWYSMQSANQIVVLMWLERHFAKKDNRKEGSFKLNIDDNRFRLTEENGDYIYNIPVSEFEEATMLPYEFANLIVRLSASCKLIDRLNHFKKTGQITDVEKKYLKASKYTVTKPKAHKKLLISNLVKPEDINEENKSELKPYLKPMTKEEENDLLLYLLQPIFNETDKELKYLDKAGSRNEVYIGEDELFNEYKNSLNKLRKMECDFVEKHTKNKDKTSLFLSLVKEKLQTQEQEKSI